MSTETRETRAVPESAVRDPYESVGPAKPFGPAAAAVLAAGVGAAALGIFTTLAEAIPSFATAITFAKPVGPLSGKVILAVATYLVSWVVLYAALRRRDPAQGLVWSVTGLLVAAGFVLTFPPFFELFAG